MKNGGARQRAKKRLRLNPLLEQVMDRARPPVEGTAGRSNDRARDRPPPSAMRCADVARDLQRRDLLPAIFFVFSRRGCEEEAKREEFTTATHTRRRGGGALYHTNLGAGQSRPFATLDSEMERVQLLTRGVAAHHAGLLPQYKTLVEDLFKRGLVKACFATETLSCRRQFTRQDDYNNSIKEARRRRYRTTHDGGFAADGWKSW